MHVPALRAAGFDVTALVGQDGDRTARRAERLGIPNALTSLEDAVTLPGVEAVSIATPPDTHAPLAVAAVEAGRHVICEKPFALNAAEAETMLDAATAAGVMHLVGHEFRWTWARAAFGAALATGAIGEPRLVTVAQYVPLVADPAAKVSTWWFDEARGGGWLAASGSHMIDAVRVWLGEFESVSAGLSVVSDRVGVADDSFTMRFVLASGVHGVLQQTGAAWGSPPGLTAVAGTDGTIWMDGDDAWLADRSGTRRLDAPAGVPRQAPPDDDPRHRFTHLELGPYTRLCEVLRAGVDGTAIDSPVPVPTFADGVACMKVLDAARASAAAADGRVVRL